VTVRKRWIAWILLLAGSAALVLSEHRAPPSGGIVEAVKTRDAVRRPADSSPEADKAAQEPAMILAIRPRAAPVSVKDVFAAADWQPKSMPVPVPTKRSTPTAPALPYTVFGKKLEDGRWEVFLRRGDRILVVKRSDTIDNTYRIDDIRPPTMTLTYLPMQTRQSLPIGAAP
jgi:hypothetical protein